MMHQTSRKLVVIMIMLSGLLLVRLLWLGFQTTAVQATVDGVDNCFVSLNNSNTTDYGSSDASALQTAADLAGPGDLLKIAGTCAGVQMRNGISQTIYISQSLTLRGGYTQSDWTTPDPSQYNTVLDALQMGRVAYISGTNKVTLESLTLRNGDAFQSGGQSDGGGLYIADSSTVVISDTTFIRNTGQFGGGIYTGWGTLQLIDNAFLNNSAAINGGAINSINTAQTMIANTVFEGNVADTNGGGVQNSSLMVINDSDFDGNRSPSGGAVKNENGTLTVTNTIFRNNVVTNTVLPTNNNVILGGAVVGGAISNVGFSSLYVSGGTFGNNMTLEDGGAIYNGDLASLILVNSDIISNTAEDNGGGIYNAGSLSMTTSIVGENSASAFGGGIWNVGQSLLQNSRIRDNDSVAGGGGIFALGIFDATVRVPAGGFTTGTIRILDSIISGNSTDNDGGGLQNIGSSLAVVVNSSIISNTAVADGGGIFNNFSVLDLRNSTLSSNHADGNGGGIVNSGSGNGTFTFTTLSANSAGNSGHSLYLSNNSTLTATNSIIAANGGPNCVLVTGASLNSAGYNLEDANDCGLIATGDMTNTNPMLKPLANNGGATPTHDLLAGSAAIDQIPAGSNGCGTTFTTDQRGFTRPINDDCDIGAVEAQQLIFLPAIFKQ